MLRITKKILELLSKKQKRFTVIIFIMMFIGSIMESVSVSLMLPLIEAVVNKETWDKPVYAKFICSLFQLDSQEQYVKILLLILIAIFIGKNAYLLLEYYVQNKFTARIKFEIQKKLLHSYISRPYTFFLYSSTGEIIRILTEDSTSVFWAFTYVMTFYMEIMVSIVLAVTIVCMSPQIASGLILVVSIELMIIIVIIKPFLRNLGNKKRDESALSNKWILQAVNGIKSIKAASKEAFFEKKYEEHIRDYIESERKMQTVSSMPRLMIEAFTISGVLLILFIMIQKGTQLNEIVPQLSAFALAAVRLLPGTNRISIAYSNVTYNEGAVDNILNVLVFDEETDKGYDLYRKQENNIEDIRFQKDILLDQISFSYPNTEKKIFDRASLKIKHGQSVGVVGSSGAGKTTMIDIMLGLLEPQNGRVLVDGTDIETNRNSWLSRVAYIPQTIFLTDSTIRENVAFGIDKDKISDDAVWDALKGAQLYEYVTSLEKGLYTQSGEGGIRLSGGQRQRLGIARALYHDPDIIFLDEATSALDHETEAAVMESIDNLKGKKTMVIIAHRKTTIENCDFIYHVKNGKILLERGVSER